MATQTSDIRQPNNTMRWPNVLLALLHIGLALLPLAAFASLYTFAWRVSLLIGHWPVASADDPKFVAPGDALCDLLYSAVMLFTLGAGAALIAFPLLTWLQRRHYSRIWLAALAIVFVMGWVLLRSDPADLFRWYMD